MTTDPYASDAGRLQAVLARWLADHGMADPAVHAADLVHIIRGHGWRPIPALQPHPQGEPGGPTPEYQARKAALVNRITKGDS